MMVQEVMNVKRPREADEAARRRFWLAYERVLQKRGVPKKQWVLHMRRVADFIRRFGDLPLKQRTIDQVKIYFRHLKEVEGKGPWGIERARQSLEMLYMDLLKMDLGAEVVGLGSLRPGERLGPDDLGERWVEAVEKMRRELQFRHYSLRTEEVYVDWALRLAKFHDGREPTKIGDEGIKAFLSHLAIDLKVAASTQNQAA